MNAGQVAVLIAAFFFAVGTCAGVYVLLKLAGLISAATELLTGYQAEADTLIRRARATADRADEQLARTGALAASVEQVSASMSDLSEQVSAIAGTGRLIAGALGAPVLRLAAVGYGIRHALTLRRARSAGHVGLPVAASDRVADFSLRSAAQSRRALRDRGHR